MNVCEKKSYGTELEAYLALDTIQRKGKVKDKTPIRSYKCHCGKYHLTSQRKNNRKNNRKK
jgi:hypothetical protein